MDNIWNDEIVESLNQYQKDGNFHPYTCAHCRDNLGVWLIIDKNGIERQVDVCYVPKEGETLICNDRLLVATNNGWICPTCNYTQDWYITLPPNIPTNWNNNG